MGRTRFSETHNVYCAILTGWNNYDVMLLLLLKIGLPYKIQNCLGKSEVRKIKNHTRTELKQNSTIYMYKCVYVCIYTHTENELGGRHRFLFKGFHPKFESTGEVY